MNINSTYYYVPKDIIINKKDWIKNRSGNKYEVIINIPQVNEVDWFAFDKKDNIFLVDAKILSNNELMLQYHRSINFVLKYQYRKYKTQSKVVVEN